MKRNNAVMKYFAALLIICLSVTVFAVSCNRDKGEEETSGTFAGTEVSDTESDTVKEDDGTAEETETEKPKTPEMSHGNELSDEEMPRLGWDETVG